MSYEISPVGFKIAGILLIVLGVIFLVGTILNGGGVGNLLCILQIAAGILLLNIRKKST